MESAGRGMMGYEGRLPGGDDTEQSFGDFLEARGQRPPPPTPSWGL